MTRPWRLGVVVAAVLFVVGVCSDAADRSSARMSPPSTQPPSTVDAASAPSGFAVRSVTDGDTLTIDDGRRVRLAQVDAPETNECFGSESTQALRALVDGRRVELRRPSNGPERDRYGRTLAEVSIAGVSVNEELVRDGAAEWYEEFASEDGDLAGRLRAAERDAKSAGKGLWALCTQPVGGGPPPVETVTAAAPSASACHAAYSKTCIPPSGPDLDCGDVRRRVRVDHARGDPHRLDADGNGWGCESYG